MLSSLISTGYFLFLFIFTFSFNIFCFVLFFETDVGADVLDLAETMVVSADGLVYEPVSLFHFLYKDGALY